MKILAVSLLLLCFTVGAFGGPKSAQAQSVKRNSSEISSTLSRLQQNPRYQGRILGTHLRKSGKSYVYEVRILRPDDSVIIVFISPQTGGVIGDSERNGKKSRSKKKK